MRPKNPHLSGLTTGQWQQLEQAVQRFEQAWQRGERPALDDFLPASGAERLAVLIELIQADLEFRLKADEPVRVEGYLQRFPDLEQSPGVAIALAAREFELRRRREPGLSPDDYLQRFPAWRDKLAARLQPFAGGPCQDPSPGKREEDDRATPVKGPVDTTSVSLLARLRLPDQEQAWSRFVELYTPLLYFWARRRLGMQTQEAADLVQDVFTLLVQKLPEFTYDQHRSFRGWLRTVLINKARENQRRRTVPTVDDSAALAEAAAPAEALVLEAREYRQDLIRRALRLMQAEFEPVTWQACWEYAVAGRPVAEVATQLGISTNAVYLAKSRVLKRLRQELDGLLD